MARRVHLTTELSKCSVVIRMARSPKASATEADYSRYSQIELGRE
jgi:hypothetical protein